MRKLRLLILAVIIISLTGCWNYRELEDLAIVGGIGIDYDGDKFKLSVNVINAKKAATGPNAGSGSDETPTTVYEVTGHTIREALNRVVLESPQKLYIGHMNLLVISDAVAKKGIYDIADFFTRDVESRKVFPMIVVKNAKASDVLKIIEPIETQIASNIESGSEATASINSIISNRQFDEILMCLYQNGRHPTITAIEVLGLDKKGQSNDNLSTTEPKTFVKIIGSASFKKDKLVGYLDEKESLGYTMIRNKVKSMTVSFKCDDKGNYGNVVIDGLSNSMKVDIVKNKPVASINLTGSGALVEYNCDTNLKDEKNIDKVKKLVDQEIKKIIEASITKTQKELKSDVFGFGERVFKDHYPYWKKNGKKWDDIFSNMDYKIKSNIKIERIGSTNLPARSR